MKWGVRRYQNKDGSLTAAGKKRYDKELEKAKAEAKIIKGRERTQAKLDKLKALQEDNASRKAALDQRKAEEKPAKEPKHKEHHLFKKSEKHMSNEELQAKVDRLALEKRYKDLMAELNPPKDKKGSRFVKEWMKKSSDNIVPQVMNHYGAKLANKLIGEEAVYANNKKKS